MLQVRSLVLALLAIIVVSCQTDSNDFTPDLGGTGTGGSLAKFAIVQNSLLVLHENAIDQYFIQHDGSLTEGRSLTFFSGGLESVWAFSWASFSSSWGPSWRPWRLLRCFGGLLGALLRLLNAILTS